MITDEELALVRREFPGLEGNSYAQAAERADVLSALPYPTGGLWWTHAHDVVAVALAGGPFATTVDVARVWDRSSAPRHPHRPKLRPGLWRGVG